MEKNASNYPAFEALPPELQDQLLQSAQIAADALNSRQRIQNAKRPIRTKNGPGHPEAPARSLKSYFASEADYLAAKKLLQRYATGAATAKAVLLFLQETRPATFRNGSYLDRDPEKALFNAIQQEVGQLGQYRGYTQKDHISDREREKLEQLYNS